MLNTYWALIISYVAFGIPLAVYLFSSFMQSIPTEMEEAAAIDGCGIYRIFFRIILPLNPSGHRHSQHFHLHLLME